MERIYHYTSIENLALILKNKTLRLNCLKNVDDMNEGITTDFDNLGSYLFASSWTNRKIENIALWNMYTPSMKGVKIGLPSDMLSLEFDKSDSIVNGKFYGRDANRGIILFAHKGYLPRTVKYMSKKKERRLMVPFEKNVELDKFHVQLETLGLIKDLQWQFQKETRLIFTAFPKNELSHYGISDHIFGDMLFGMMDHVDFDLSCIDLPLKPEALDQIEITLGPHCTDSDQIIVESLVKSLLQSKEVIIKKSSLKIRKR